MIDDTAIDPAQTDFEEIPPPVEEAPPAPEKIGKPVEQVQMLFHETEEGKILSSLVDELEREDFFVRETMIRVWKKHENYWRDRQYVIWDEMTSDWRTPGEMKTADPTIDIDPAAYAKSANIYKAHGEAIISALSSGLPHVKFFPDDADVHEDVFTAKAYSKIAELIAKRNKAHLLFIRALYLLYNCGTVFAYNENKDTTQFGTVKRPIWGDADVIDRQHICPNCGTVLGSEQFDAPVAEGGAESVQGANDLPLPGPTTCPQCLAEVSPDFEDYENNIPRLTGYSEDPKSHECIEVFSGLHVKIPHWVRAQSQTPYLTLEDEEDEALLMEVYPEVAHLISPTTPDTNERTARLNSDYNGDYPRHLATLRRTWVRPWAYNRLGPAAKSDDIALLKSKYPDGVYVVKVNDLIVEAVPDKLDDHWTITVNPLSNQLHADPLSQPLLPMQDVTNELLNLTLETVEFGIPETFYEAEAIESEKYKLSEARPGMLYPAKARNQMGLDSNFHTIKTATLSQEVDNFSKRVEQYGQLVVGAQPTIWGGALEGAGGTAREVEQSKASALQRLNLTWIMVKIWWAELMSKSVRSFAINLTDDEKYVEAKGKNFVNVWIRRAELTGKVGQVEPDISEAFPVTWAQQRDVLMNLLGMKNQMVDVVIAHPENAGVVASRIGFPDFYIPGDDDRDKQLEEISQLILAEPMVLPPQMPMGGPEHGGDVPPVGQEGPPPQEQLKSTITVEKWENHAVEAETCRAWLKSEVGRDCKQTNPAGYMNVVAHMEEHDMFGQQEAMAAQAAQGDGNEHEDKPPVSEGN
jgi:hypothetical protein